MTLPVTFTGAAGTLLPAYDADWEKITDNISGDWKINENGNAARRATASQNGMAVYKAADAIPSSANYIVKAGFIKKGNSTERIGIMARASDTTRNGYVLRWTNGTSTTLTLMKATNASPVIMGSAITLSGVTNGVPRNLGLRVDGNQISAIDLDNGNAVLIGPITDTDHTAAGYIGLWYTSDSTSATTTTGVDLDNLDIEYLAAPFVYESDAQSSSQAAGALSTAIQLAGNAVATVAAAAILTTGSALMSAEAESRTSASASLSTSIPLAAAARSSSSGQAQLGYVPTYLDLDVPGCNVDATSVVITGADTLTPTIRFAVRTPDDAEWQQYLAKARNMRGKTATIEVSVAGKEVDPDTYLGTYQGPWHSPTITADTWSLVSSFTVTGGYKTYQVSGGANDDVYIASIPPLTQESALAWIQSLESAHPTLVHDDLPSRLALAVSDPPNAGPYICSRSGAGEDENAREVTNLPMYGFRLGNDSLGTQPKRRIVLFCGVHCGEWNGFHMLKGFADEYLAGTHATALQTNFDVYIYPLHSILGNYLGFRRAEPLPSGISYDANREWADGDTTVPTVVKWQQNMDADHGVSHGERVVVFLDFHDGKKTSDKSWYYYQPGFANQAAWHALVQAENSEILAEESTADGTTQDYWFGKGVAFTFNPEVADEKSTITELEGYGAAYARAIKAAEDADLLPQIVPTTATATATSSAQAALTTGISLQAAGGSTGAAGALLNTGAQFQIEAVARSAAQASLSTQISVSAQAISRSECVAQLNTAEAQFAAGAHSVGVAAASIQTAITVSASAISRSQASCILVEPDMGAPAGNITHRSLTPVLWSAPVRA